VISPSPRAVSPVIANILLVSIVVILAATISVFALGFTDEADRPGPVVGQSSGELVGDNGGSDNQIIRITHIAGDTVSVSNMEVMVTACGETTRIVNLPAERFTPTYIPFDEAENFEGNTNLLSEGQGDQFWDAGVLHEDTSDEFNSGKSFELRVRNTMCSLKPGDEVQVQILHTPTNSIVIDQTLTAT
jgi:flagellin-like protein